MKTPTASRPLAFLAVVLGVAVGVVGGHYAWTASSTPKTRSTASRPGGQAHFPNANPQFPGGGNGFTGGCTSSGCSFHFNGGSSASGGGFGGGSGNVASSITKKVDPAIVDINTQLGYQQSAAAGTGMVVTSSGEVITNNHVIVGATKITATDVGNGKTYTARVIGYDYGHDIAVLQLENASNLQTVSLASSSSLSVGQRVATIGNAGGAGGTQSAAVGRISGVNQSITAGDPNGSSEHLTGLIELDGDLQPGDSGGPLVDSAGRVIGIDTAASSTFQFESAGGRGFAIPIDTVKTIARDILTGTITGKVHIGGTPFLGVTIDGRSTATGATIVQVLSGTPAAGSALASGDTITALDGTSVTSPANLTQLILHHHPGDQIKLSYHAKTGPSQTASVTLTSGPPQ